MSKELKQMLITLLLAICLSTGTSVVANREASSIQATKIEVIEKKLDKVDTSSVSKDIEYIKATDRKQDEAISKIHDKNHLIELSQREVLVVIKNLTKAIEKLNDNQDSFKDALIRYKTGAD